MTTLEPRLAAGFSSAVRRGQLVWIGGHLGEGADDKPGPDELRAQMPPTLDRLAASLDAVGCELTDLTKLSCFYADTVDGETFLAVLREALPDCADPVVTAIPVPYFSVPGSAVLVEGYAMRGEDDAVLDRRPLHELAGEGAGPFPLAVRCGRMIFVGAQRPVRDGQVVFPGDIVEQTREVMRRVGDALGTFGADFDDVVKINRWYVGSGTVQDFEPAALACGAHFREPGPAATGIPVPALAVEGQQITIEVVAMRGEDGQRLPRRHVWPDSLWDWTIKLPYHHGLKCHDLIFLGGQVSLDKDGHAVHPDEIVPQTRQSMEHIATLLRALGADLSDLCKLTTMYAAEPVSERHQDNLQVRATYAAGGRTAATDIPLPVLAYPAMIIEIDGFATVEPDDVEGASS